MMKMKLILGGVLALLWVAALSTSSVCRPDSRRSWSSRMLEKPGVAQKSGVAHLVAEDEAGVIRMLRELLSYLPSNLGGRFSLKARTPSR